MRYEGKRRTKLLRVLSPFAWLYTTIAASCISGCSGQPWFNTPAAPHMLVPGGARTFVPRVPLNDSVTVNNPVPLAEQDPEFIWQQIIDTVDDYFRIKTEIRFQRDASQWREGRVETFPELGATILETWRKDALPGFQRWQSTFQTIRRTTYIRVTPMSTGYSLAIEVVKELEDVDRSASAGETSASVRHDGTIVRADTKVTGQPITLGWIRQENDTELEQRILREILGRLTEVSPPRKTLISH